MDHHLPVSVLYSQTTEEEDDSAKNDADDPSSSLPPNQQKEETNPILLGVAQAKISGILCIATLLSQGAYDRGGGDISAFDGILGFPPGGPIVIAVAIVSGGYTLWKIQPILAAVR